jgi:hypothetical protein
MQKYFGYHRPADKEELRRAEEELERQRVELANAGRLETLKSLADNPYYTASVVTQLELDFREKPFAKTFIQMMGA